MDKACTQKEDLDVTLQLFRVHSSHVVLIPVCCTLVLWQAVQRGWISTRWGISETKRKVKFYTLTFLTVCANSL